MTSIKKYTGRCRPKLPIEFSSDMLRIGNGNGNKREKETYS